MRLWLVVVLLAGCGSRTGLLVDGSATLPGADGDTDVDSDSDADIESDTDDDSDTDADAEPPCSLASSGVPVEVYTADDRDAHTPSMVALGPTSLALQTVTEGGSEDGIELIGLDVGESWPGGVVQDRPTLLVGGDSWTYAQMSPVAGGGPDLALTWLGDRPWFRTVDVAAWAARDLVEMAPESTTPLALAPGAGVGPFGVGYEGAGYGVAWHLSSGHPDYLMAAAAGVLDEGGRFVLGMHPLTAPREEGRTPAMVWSGETYLLATGFGECLDDEPLCVPHGVVVTRLRPATGDLVDDSGIDLVAAVPTLERGSSARSPALVSDGERTYLAWREQRGSAGTYTVRLVRLDPGGLPLGEPSFVAEDAAPVAGITLALTRLGLVVAWVQEGEPRLADDEPGRSLLVVRLVDHALERVDRPPPLGITLYGSAGPRAALALERPRSALLTWSGRSRLHERRAVFLARFHCAGG